MLVFDQGAILVANGLDDQGRLVSQLVRGHEHVVGRLALQTVNNYLLPDHLR